MSDIVVTSNLNDVSDLDGVYAVEVPPPSPIRQPGADWMGFLGQFAWGPTDTPVVIDSTGQYLDMFAPAGQGYAYAGHQALARTQPARLKVIRVKGSGAAKAAMTIQTSGGSPVNVLRIVAKYFGALPISIVIAAAGNGDAECFKLTVVCGNESETYDNLQTLSGSTYAEGSTGVFLGDQSRSKFLAPLAAGGGSLTSSTRPVNGTYVLGASATNVTSVTAGADGTVGTASYSGTSGTGDAGVERFTGDADVRALAIDDCGDTHRVAINTAVLAWAAEHGVDYYFQGDAGTSDSDARADLATNASAYRDERGRYCWPWAYVLDESGAEILVPPGPFVAAAVTHMPRHLGTHWKDDRNTRYYSRIKRLEFVLGRSALILMKRAGIEALVQTSAGGYAPKSGVTTSLTAGKTTVARCRIRDFIVRGLADGQEAYEGGPIDEVTRAEQRARVEGFLKPLKEASANGTAAVTEAIADYSVKNASSSEDLANGIHKMAVKVRSLATQDAIAFLLSVGPTVTVDEVQAA